MHDVEPQRAQHPLDLAFENERGFQRALTEARHGDGIGARVIMRFLGDGDAEKCPRTKREIADALSNLKDSGIYDEIEAELPPRPDQEETETEQAQTKRRTYD